MSTTDLGKRLREAREEAGLSIRQLAERSGMSPSGIFSIEKGERDPGVETVRRLALALEVDACWLAYGKGEP